ncbi:transcriptional regulator [Paenibacillus athensensis]|uniref:Transcriptional regulator n=1 Tax=Paenibacillus athensensis TaxID=1967502 RepID=A0A4Y8Q3R1_9BACL|nr:transcriptional regulator [Paenibacillus athensensis]MCD1259169.1 transcriptional regulator [Paenibacillus athensensis]
MGMATKVKMLLAARGMTIADLANRLEPKTTNQNVAAKLRRDNLSEYDLHQIAKACNATFEGIFTLNDTGKQI